MWTRIWCKVVWNDGGLSPIFMHHFIHLLHNHINLVAIHRIYTDFPTPGSTYNQSCCSVYEVSHSWFIRVWNFAKHFEVSSDSKCCHASCYVITCAFGGSCGHIICFGSMDHSRIPRSSISYFNLLVALRRDTGLVREIREEI